MRHKKVLRSISILLAIVLVLQGVVFTPSTSEAAKKATLKTKNVTLVVGEKKTISIKNKVKKNTYTFSSMNKKVAKVGAKTGIIIARGKGSTSIKVRERYKKSGKYKFRTVGNVKVKVKAKTSATKKPTTTPTATSNATPTGKPQVTPTVKPTTTPTTTPTATPTASPSAIVYANDFEDEDLNGFTYMGNVKLTCVSDEHNGGTKSLKVSGRTDEWNGTTLSVSEFMVNDQEYTVTMYVMQKSGADVKFSCTLTYSDSEGTAKYDPKAAVTAKSGVWTELKATMTINADMGAPRFYIEAANKTADYYLDDVSVYGVQSSGGGSDDISDMTSYYNEMIGDSLVSTGNNVRIKNAIAKAQKGESVKIACIGGSITEGAGATTSKKCYAYRFYEKFKAEYGKDDGDNVTFVNAGMSGTPSTLGWVRYQRDVVDQLGGQPDILIVEFAVNDSGEPTGGDAYESMVRSALMQENAPAVMLLFGVFKSQWNMQSTYTPIGEAYSLPMVSIRDAIVPKINDKSLTNKTFFDDDLHPNNTGHEIMADCLMNCIDTMNKETAASSDIILPTTAVKGLTYMNIQSIFEGSVPTGAAISAGGFSATDTETTQFKQNGLDKFPTNWQHTSKTGTEKFTMTITSRNLMFVYKLSSAATAGKVNIYVDGTILQTVNSFNDDGWNNAATIQLFNNSTAATHTIDIEMASGDEAKDFTIFAFGYSE